MRVARTIGIVALTTLLALPATANGQSHSMPIQLAAGSGSSGSGSSRAHQGRAARSRGQRAPRIQTPPLQIQEWVRGPKVTLEGLKGKVVMLDIFQIICPGCHAVHPHIVEMQEKYGSRGLQVVGVAVAFELEHLQTPRDIRDYVRRSEFNYPVGIDQDLTRTFRAYGSRGTPYVALIDKAGYLRYRDFYNPPVIERALQVLLSEPVAGD